jgi:hypothetical protein
MAHVSRQDGASSLSALAARTTDKARRRIGTVRSQDVLDDGWRLFGRLFRHELVEEPVLELGGELLALRLVPLLPVE